MGFYREGVFLWDDCFLLRQVYAVGIMKMEVFAMRLYLVRHGQTDMNKRNMFYGWTDADINETGVQQAEQLREQIEYYSKLYYEKDDPAISDYEFDQLMHRFSGTLLRRLGKSDHRIHREELQGRTAGVGHRLERPCYAQWRKVFGFLS